MSHHHDAPAWKQLGACNAGPEVGNLTICELAYLNQHPEHPMMQMIDHDCHGRPSDKPGERLPCPDKARFKCMAYFSELTVCDKCRADWELEQKMKRAREYWEHICPEDYRDTRTDHPDFPKGVYSSLAKWDGTESLFFYGPSGACKTRIAMMLLKRRLIAGDHVGILWPEEMKDAAKSPQRLDKLRLITRYKVLLMDDSLLTGAQDEKIADFLKDVVEMAIRNKRTLIFTSQIGGDDYLSQGNKFNNQTKTDSERIRALLRRIRERCRVVPFVEVPNQSHSNRSGPDQF